jgi:hypothetical protein
VEYEGTARVRKVWDGRANLLELELSGQTGHLEGLSLRLYNPQSRQWSVYFATSQDGALGTPMMGQFQNGRGEFFVESLFTVRPSMFVLSSLTSPEPRFTASSPFLLIAERRGKRIGSKFSPERSRREGTEILTN